MPRLAVWMFAVATMVLGVSVVSAQNYPNKPVRLITSGLGGASDFAARLIAQGLTNRFGQRGFTLVAAGAAYCWRRTANLAGTAAPPASRAQGRRPVMGRLLARRRAHHRRFRHPQAAYHR